MVNKQLQNYSPISHELKATRIYQNYTITHKFELINYQPNAFFSSIRVNFVRVKVCTASYSCNKVTELTNYTKVNCGVGAQKVKLILGISYMIQTVHIIWFTYT